MDDDDNVDDDDEGEHGTINDIRDFFHLNCKNVYRDTTQPLVGLHGFKVLSKYKNIQGFGN